MSRALVSDKEIIDALYDKFGHKVYYVYDITNKERNDNVFFIYYGMIEESKSNSILIETLFIEHIRTSPEDDVRLDVLDVLPDGLTFRNVKTGYRVADDYKTLIQIDTYEVSRKIRKCKGGC